MQQYVYNDDSAQGLLRIVQFNENSKSWSILDPASKRLYGELHKLYNWQTLENFNFVQLDFQD